MSQEIKVRTKPDELCAQLLVMAQRLGPGARLPAGRALSEAFGVSRTTLHVAMERLEAQNVIRRRHGSGVYVSSALPPATNTRTLALVVHHGFLRPAGHSAFWDLLIEQVQARATDKNEVCQLHLTSPVAPDGIELQEALRDQLRSGSVQGVLGVGLSGTAANWIIAQGVPYVSYAGWSPCCVAFDQRVIFRLGIEELARQGCRRLALWGALGLPADEEGYRHGAQAAQTLFREELEHAGLPLDTSLLELGLERLKDGEAARVGTGQEQGYDTATKVFSSPRCAWPDGVLIADDMMTHGALFALERLGVRVGEDVRIASHANRGSSVLASHDERLILMEVDPDELVQTLFDQLEILMNGEIPETPAVELPPRLRVTRGSPAVL